MSGKSYSAYLDYDQIERIIRDPQVAGVTLTGSEAAGVKVAASAGSAN